MANDLSLLITEIITTGKGQGMDQKDIAASAGVNPVSLSRLNSASDAKFSTLNVLATAVGLKIVLVPDSELAEKVRKGEVFDD